MGVRNVVSDDEEEYEKDNARDALDTEAAEAEDGEDEEEEGQDEYEKDGFIVDDVEEEEEVREGRDEEMKARKKKKKREAEENYELDEDDYELLQEANVTGFHRPKAGSKKFKRLKKVGRNNDKAGKTSFSDDNEMEEGGRTSTTAEEKLKHSLFGDYEGVPQEDVVEKEDLLEEEYVGEEDEMEDFIVDDEEVDENGLPVRRRKLNKILPRQVRGISSSALQEAQDIFGAVDEILAHRKQGMKGKGFGEGLDDNLGAKGLLDEFEPSVLAEKYMTAKDDQIRETDVPERFQLSEEISGPYPHNEDTLREAKWIYEQVFGSLAVLMRKEFQHIAKLDKKEVVKEIANVLQMCHDKKLEVPFVAMYRKEMCLNILRDKEDGSIEAANKESRGKLRTYKALWAIQHWDRKWLLLQRRKNALKASYEKRAGEEARRDLIKLKLLDSVFQSLDDAESERTVDDIDAKFNLHFPPDEVEVEGGQFKRPKHKSLYRICRKSGLGVVSRKFGLTSEQLGKNLSAMYKRHEVEDASAIPGDIATEFCVGEFGDPQSVLKGARHMAAVEISCEPAVKEYVRSIYMERAVVTTKPTTDGNNAIDSFHQYAGVKWLLNKPTNMFDNAQWLLIQKAEEEKLLQVTIGLPKDAIDKTLMPEFENQYLSDGVSRDAQLWNEQRKLILKDVLCNYILPSMEKEARMMLSVRAKSWLVQDYWMQLWKKVSVAPFQHQIDDNEERCQEDFETRVMACCQGSGKDPTTFVMLDPSGEVLDILFTSHLSIRSKNPGLLKRKENDQQRLSKFIMDHQPHIVVLGASNIRCKCLMDGICEAIFKMVEEHPCEMAEGLDSLNVVYADEVLPHLYENSRISRDQLPTQRGIVRRAVALGRYLQNPVAMVATLCGPGREILSLKLHSLEHFLSTDDRYEAVDQVMITVTNQVGVDINLAASHEWMFAPLQFVAGLGPRKAASIRRVILRAGHVFSRRELLTTLGAMQRLVFINAAGFLRVRRTGQAASGNHVMDPLDDTRIHPESYELAKKMAEDVYCEDVGKDIDDMDEEHQEMAIEHVKSHPHLLKALDIDEYARSVEQRLDNKKRETLDDIKIELLYGFQEWRPPYKQPSQDEEFLLLTGENEETLAEGKIVQVTVRRVLNQRVFCDLESGITGMIKKEELSDDRDIDPVEKITEGSIFTCRVKNVQKAKCLVDLTCKPSELRVDHRQSRQDKDRYYAEADCILQSEQEKACKEKELAKKSFKPRMIVHPRFQNISENDAIKNLLDKDAGESIIRPSSKGPFYLTITLKVFDGVYAHKDIVEGGKDHRDFASFLRLGKALSIGEETYKDLDEVIDRYVDPLVSNLKAILAYDKFKRGTKAEIDEALHKEKSESPAKIPCCISVSHEHPGAFLLSYVRSTNHHHEYFGIYPKGFRFRKRMFDNLDKLVAYFQKHMNDLVQDSIPLIRSVAAMVPMKSPDTGGSTGGGGSVGSGWGGSATNSVGGGDGGRQGHTGMNWGRSSTPGSRTGGNCYNANNPMVRPPSGLSRPPNGRDRGRQGRGSGSRGEGRGGGSRGGGCTEGRGGGSRGGGWSEGGDGCGRSGGWSDGGYCDSRDGRWGGGGGGRSRDSGWGGGGGDSSRDSGWGGGGGGGGGRDCGWGRGGGGRDGSWGRGESGGSRDGGWGGRGDGGSMGGGWREGGGFSKGIGRGEGDGGIADGRRSQGGGGWGEGGVGGSGDSGRSEGRGGWGEGGGGGSGDGGKSEGKGGWGGGGGGSSGDGGRSEGRRGGFGRGRSEGRGKGNRGRWSEDRGNRRGRSGGRGRGSGRGGLESNFTNGWGQNSGGNHISGSFSHKQESGAWGSKADGWGGNSVKRIPESPARGCWTASTGESGWNKQGNNGWDAIKVSEGWNSSRVSDIDAMSKDRTGGCDTVNKTGNSEMPGSSNGCDGWDDGNKVGSGSWDNNSMGGAGGWCQPTKSNDDRCSVKIADRRSPNSFNGFGGKSNAGWGGTEVGKSNAGWGAEAGMPGDAWRGPQAANSNDAWGATEAAKSNLEWGGTEEGKNDGWEMDGGKENDRWEMDGGKGNDGGANGCAIDSDGWSHLTAGGNVNAGGSGWGS